MFKITDYKISDSFNLAKDSKVVYSLTKQLANNYVWSLGLASFSDISHWMLLLVHSCILCLLPSICSCTHANVRVHHVTGLPSVAADTVLAEVLYAGLG